MLGVGEDLVGRPALGDAARVHDAERVAHARHHAEGVGDEDDRGAKPDREFLDDLEDLGLDGDVEGARGLVRDQDLGVAGQAHRDHDALAHAARELVRVLVDALLGAGDAGQLEHVDCLGLGRLLVESLVQDDRLDHLRGDPEEGVQRGHRVLEDHGDLVASDLPDVLRGHLHEVLAHEEDLAAGDLAGGIGDHVDDGEVGDALARTRLADDPEGLAAAEIEGDAVYGLHHAFIRVEIGFQVLDLKDDFIGHVASSFVP
jgi:hypothetical protein